MPTGVLLMTGTADAESCQWDLLKAPPNYLREEEVALGRSEENCTYYGPGGGVKKFTVPRVLRHCPLFRLIRILLIWKRVWSSRGMIVKTGVLEEKPVP
jgi:hypothetical protein